MLQFFADSRFSKWMSRVLTLALLFNNLLLPTQSFGLTGGPSQDEFSGFEPAGSTEMVNLFSGDFTYNIPLLDVDGYPVNIAFHSNPGIEEEAGWVGLGWTLNSGAINRGVRGLPDDFKQEQINREVSFLDHKAWGVSLGGGFEFSGYGGFSAGAGVVYSNYKGWGYEYCAEPTMALSAANTDGCAGGFSAGLGLRVSSQDGATFNAHGGISGEYQRGKEATVAAGLGINIGTASNSRTGRDSWSLGVSGKLKFLDDRQPMASIHKSFTGVTPLSSTAFSPRLDFDRVSNLYSYDIKGGAASCALFTYGSIRGFFSNSKLASNTLSYDGYGYMYEHESVAHPRRFEKVMLDYSRDKDGSFYAETPNAPVTSNTFDMFRVTGQGLSGAFHASRNDIAVVYDPRVRYQSTSTAVGGELGVGTGLNIGLNVNDVNASSESGFWKEEDYNQLNPYIGFKGDEALSTSANVDKTDECYFRFSGEKVFDNTNFNAQIGNDRAVRPVLEAVGKKKYRTTSELEYGTANKVTTLLSAAATSKTERNKRENLVSYLTVTDAASFGLDKDIANYSINTSGAASYPATPASTITRLANAGTKAHHISEISVLQTNGSRYVYGIPVYNRLQREVVFATAQTPLPNTNEGLVSYGFENTLAGSRVNTVNEYYEKNEVPEYAHSFLITAVLSPDYVDRNNDGVTDDDLGSFTKFKYSKLTGTYNWRMPADAGNTAYYAQGMYSDVKDQKGSYTYGQKDIWYARSIESKNYFAEFILDDRLDGLQVNGDNGGINATPALKKLKQIKLYAKPKYDQDPPTLIKTVNFEYDYALCPNTPNSSASGKGKLTLKKIWFTEGNSSKGIANPYVFFYADPSHLGHPVTNNVTAVDANYNAGYGYGLMDRWGQYKSPATNPGTDIVSNILVGNTEYPYTLQINNTNVADVNLLNNKNANQWNLNTIYTPSGSKICVDFEADQYAYVNDKPAAQFYEIMGFSSSSAGPFSSVLHDGSIGANTITGNNYIRIKLTGDPGVAGLVAATNKEQYFKDYYLNGEGKIYFRCYVKLNKNDNASYEYISGYADVDNVASPIQVAGTEVVVKLKGVQLNDKKTENSSEFSPVAKAALQIGRLQVPKVIYPGSEPAGSNVNKITTLGASMGDIRAMYKGVNKYLAQHEFCKSVYGSSNYPRNFVRLYNAAGKKFGGGSRVKQITMNDSWGGMTSSSEASADYGQVFDYTVQEGDRTISSGVASYEPLSGGDENSNRRPIDFSVKASASLNNSFFQEMPYCESLYPNATVGYSRVTVKNLSRTNVVKNATGYVEHQFYTTRDYPTKEERTTLNKQRVRPNLLNRVFNIKNDDKVYLSQGFVVKTNDMFGRLKSVRNFAENQSTPISGVKYNYKTKTDAKELDNVVSVLGPDKVVSQQELGVEIDVVNDARMSKSEVSAFSSQVNVTTMACQGYIPVAFYWPNFTKSRTEFYSSTICKTVQKFGILESVEAFDNNSSTKTSNLLYDQETGEVLLSSTTNQFNKPVYTFNYPAYWAYDGMGSAHKNTGMEFLDVCNYATNLTFDCGKITITNPDNYFFPGDEVVVYNAVSYTNPQGTFYKQGSYLNTCWVIRDLAPNNSNSTNGMLFLIDKDGARVNTTNFFTSGAGAHYLFKIKRSGRRNLQTNSIGTLTSLNYPVASGMVLAGLGVLSANAVEYDEKWNMLCEKCSPKTLNDNFNTNTQVYNSIYCNATGGGNNLLNALSTLISTNYNNAVYSPYPVPSTKLFAHNAGNQTPDYTFSRTSTQAPNWANANSTGLLAGLGPLADLAMCGNYCVYSVPFNPPKGCYYKFESYSCKWWSSYPSQWNVVKIDLQGSALWDWKKPFKRDDCGESYSYANIVLTMPTGANNDWANVTSVNNLQVISAAAGASYDFSGQANLSTGGSVAFTGKVNSGCYGALGTCVAVPIDPVVDNCMVNPYLNGLRGIWRPKRAYDYFVNRSQAQYNQGSNREMSGNLVSDGDYGTFTPFWWYPSSPTGFVKSMNENPNKNSSPYNKWVKTSETDKIDWFGNTYQARDILGRPASTIYGYNNSLPIATAANAYANELLTDGFEDRLSNAADNTNLTCDSKFHFNYGAPDAQRSLSTTYAHTGTKSLQLAANTTASQTGRFTDITSATSNSNLTDAYTLRPATSRGIYILKAGDYVDNFSPFSPGTDRGKFVLSVWVRVASTAVYDEYPNVGAKLWVSNTGNGVFNFLTPTSVEKSPIVNGWQKQDYYYNAVLSYGGSVAQYRIDLYNTNTGASACFDDLRVHPFSATMQTKVYNPKTLQLMAELDDKNFATYYEYDEDLSLVRVKKETERGIFTIKETRTGLKK